MCRKRGRIVLVGVVGMEMSRADFYEKELSFQVSCSYGPGRYDVEYEEKGNDYPAAFVRWTEQRNFEAILDMMADGRINMQPLISHRFKLEQAAEAYDLISNGNPLGVLLEYQAEKPTEAKQQTVALDIPSAEASASKAVLGFIGAGNYTSSVLAPAFEATGARLKSIASATGVSSVLVGKKNHFEEASTNAEDLFEDASINGLVITTRHNSHANWVVKALNRDKHVFVEKPLALTREDLNTVTEAYREALSRGQQPALMVGFNRRYSPLIREMKRLVSAVSQPLGMVMTVNAGAIPADHWTQDMEVGGGRIIGEGCHFIDLLRHVADAPIESVSAIAMDSQCKDSVMIQLRFQNGSIGTVNYLANGSKAFPKERLEVFAAGGILQLDNFRTLKGYGWKGFKKSALWRQDKGQKACADAFVAAIESGDHGQLIPFEELVEVAEACFDVVEVIGDNRLSLDYSGVL
jgi:predicted dehydrogenase